VYPYRRELNHAGFFPPLGLEFIAAVVRRHAQSLDLIDLRKERRRTRDFLRPETDLVCFSVNWDRDRQFLAEEILSVPPGILVIIGGRFATECPDWWLAQFPSVKAVVRGDGEEAMEEICRGAPWDRITGLSYRQQDQIRHNPNRKLGPVRNDVYPDRSLRRSDYHVELARTNVGIKIDAVATSRGCPFNCTFCSFSRNPWGEKRRWTSRSPESVVEELTQIKARLVGFTDDLFTHDMDRVERICDLIIARGIRKRYFVNARLEIARRPDILAKMERAGFSMLMLGIESAHDKTLKSMRKGHDVAAIRQHCEILRRSKMILHGYFILGCIGESPDDMLRIGPFAHELGLDTIALSTLRSSPYSGLDSLVAESPGYHTSPSGKIYSDSCSTEDLRRLRRRIHKEFYSPAQLARIAMKGIQNGALGFLPHMIPRLPFIAGATIRHVLHRFRRRSKKQPGPKNVALPCGTADGTAQGVEPLLAMRDGGGHREGTSSWRKE
jgi:radical SAM superfamily enzyme YgiQ (UPF0313 family)